MLEVIKKYKLVPVVVVKDLADAENKLGALCDGGLPIAELTFRTACAEEAIKMACQKFPNMIIGAGTIINGIQCKRAIKAGAKFIVGPGFSEEVAKICKRAKILYIPGCVTPSEIIKALSFGLDIIKFFPCSNFGGLSTLKALSAPFPQVKFMPTGGVTEENVLDYLSFDKVIGCGGSWMMKGTREEIQSQTASALKKING